MEGIETEGRASVPPMAGPMIVPIDHTNGITAYAFAVIMLAFASKDCVDKAHAHAPVA